MAVDEERAAFVALALVPGISPTRRASLLEHCTTALGALSAPFAFLCTVPGMSRAAATALAAASPAHGARVLDQAEALGARAILINDPEYPGILRDIPDPPALLFALGNPELLAGPAVAIVGSRNHSPYGRDVAALVAGAAARAGIAVISGMARGLDAVAHGAALDAGGPTIGVLGNGLGVVYPAANRELYQRVGDHGLLLTEFPPGDRPMVYSFPRRNRIISGLARVTVVVEAAEGSGTLITVGAALAQGRDVMAVPGPITSPTSVGTNRLIRDGAEPLLGPAGLLEHFPEAQPGTEVPSAGRQEPGGAEDLGPPGMPASAGPLAVAIPPGLTPAERCVAEALQDGPLGLDALILRLGLPAAQALVAISGLELRGVARHDAGWVRWAVEGEDSHARLR
jgi:DNA processing protein